MYDWKKTAWKNFKLLLIFIASTLAGALLQAAVNWLTANPGNLTFWGISVPTALLLMIANWALDWWKHRNK